MTLDLTDEQSRAVQRGEVVRLNSSDLGDIVILPTAAYEALSEEQEQTIRKSLNDTALERWGRENPY